MKYAICNELFVHGNPTLKELTASRFWTLAEAAQCAAALGYRGLEIAPFTLGPDPVALPARDRQRLRQEVESTGLHVVGLHWLLAGTQGLHLTDPDPAVRRRTAEHVTRLVDLCADLGGSIMVWGSPFQRSLRPGVTPARADAHAIEVWESVLPLCKARGVTIALEPLTPAETDFVTTAEQARRLIRRVNHTNFRLHLDTKAMSSEGTPIPQIVRDAADVLVHFHANDPNLRGPGDGDLDHGPIAAALHELGYRGWVSVEVFDFRPDPATIGRRAIDYLTRTYGAPA